MLGLAITALQAAVVLLLIWRSDGWTAHPLGRTVAAPEAASARPADDDGPLAISVMRLAVPDRSTSSPNLTTHVVSCPLYSGPGYDAKRHASREVTLPAFEAPFASTPRPPTLSVEAVPLSDVRLTPGSAFHAAFETNLQYLKVRVRVSVSVSVRVRVRVSPNPNPNLEVTPALTLPLLTSCSRRTRCSSRGGSPRTGASGSRARSVSWGGSTRAPSCAATSSATGSRPRRWPSPPRATRS